MNQLEDQLYVRTLSSDDWAYVARLASQNERFTIPSEYVIWMLARTSDKLSLLAVRKEQPAGYILSLPAAKDELFVWQFAVEAHGLSRIADSLADELVARARISRVKAIEFTLFRHSKAVKWVESWTHSRNLKVHSSVDMGFSMDEPLFRVDL